MKIDYLNGADIDRQDCVDNAIFGLINELATDKEVEWDIEDIANVREVVENILVNKLKLMTEFEFYPYVEIHEDGTETLPQEVQKKRYPDERDVGEEIIVTDEQLVTAIKKAIEDLDEDELAMFAGDILGGLCWPNGDETYTFGTTENYWDAFDFLKDAKNGKD